MSLSRVFSGIQPSGDVQLGNYLGAIKGWVDRQDEKDNFFCIVDLHALTVYQDPNNLNHQIKSLAAILFAAGLDPAKCSVFIQSHVKEHSELCWLLNCITPNGWLERMTQYKDKSSGQESVSTGLLDYPVLMASAMKHAIIAGRESYLAGRMMKKAFASATSPLENLI